ncbi:MAG TPA: hypothetical protein VMU61_03610 [Candidatus Aquilonibacter sp.]|nr:hypothetical protein [Candidatus Aquilonibacter sp.]
MKQLAVVVLLALELAVLGCGSSTPTNTAPTAASGTWQAVLVGGSGEASTLNFVTTFSVNGDSSLDVTGIQFITVGPCFGAGSTAGGSLSVSNSTGVVTGPFSFSVQSGTGNTLTLAGTENGTVITGTWTLNGSGGCDDSDSTTQPSRTFTMCQGSGPCKSTA